jgi:hypothetical protein
MVKILNSKLKFIRRYCMFFFSQSYYVENALPAARQVRPL